MNFRSLKNVLLSNRNSSQIVAFTDESSVCWAKLLSDINVLRTALMATPKQDCAICCDDSYYFCVAFFAAIYADKKIVLPGNHQPAMLEQLSAHFDLIIHDGLVDEHFNKQHIQLPLPTVESAKLSFYDLNLAQIKITLFTSGSSGLPKSINKTLLTLNEEVCTLEEVWGELIAGTDVVSTVSHQHIYGLLFRILWPLCAGRAFHRHDLAYPEQVAAYADNNRSLISSPALLKRLQADRQNGQYRAVFSSGGPLSLEAAKQCFELFKHYPFEVFGSTETGGIGYRQQLTSATPWTFFSGISVQLGEDNCLKLLSPCIDPEFWYQTSDQCELLENNQFILKGRVDRIVKIEEKRISLVEVEQRLNQLQWIDESATLVLNDLHRLTLGAVIKLTEEGKKTLLEQGKGKFYIQLRQALRLWVEPVGIPRHYRVVSEIPVNKQGKRLHSEILQLFKAG